MAKAQLAIVASIEQMNGGIRLKETKTGRDGTVALPATVVEELKAHRLQQAQDLLRLGIRLTDDSDVAAQFDGSLMQPTFITHEWIRVIATTGLPRVRFHDERPPFVAVFLFRHE